MQKFCVNFYPERARGVAVVTALLLTALAVTIVAGLFWQQQVQVRSIENQRLQLQSQWILRGALDWASLILREDGKHSTVDFLSEAWAVPLAETRLDEYIDNGRSASESNDAVLSGRIVDAQSRFNLTNLSIGGVIDQRAVSEFERLLRYLHVNSELADTVAQTISETQRAVEGVVAGDKSTHLAPVRYVEDIQGVAGMTPQNWLRLKEFVVVLPRPTPVNMNTASAELIAAVLGTTSIQDARALVIDRDKLYFQDREDFVKRLLGKNTAEISRNIAFSTYYFVVYGTVRLNRASTQMQALVERSGVDNSTKTNIVWMRYY